MRRFLQVAGGAVAVATALYVIVGEHLAGTSADAVINAQLLHLRAPVAGELTLQVRNPGRRFAGGETVGTIRNDRPDDVRLSDLRRVLAANRIEQNRLHELHDILAERRAGLERQSTAYGTGRVEQLEARLAEARALEGAARSRQREAGAALQRGIALSRSGVQAETELHRARLAAEVADRDLEAARTRIRYLEVEQEAAARGVFLGDSYSDSPFSRQRAWEMEQRQSELAAELRERAAQATMLQRAIDAELVRLVRMNDARLLSPERSMLWDIASNTGEHVRQGQDIARLVDCGSIVVTASVRESVYNRLKVGDPAQFVLFGNRARLEGTVARLAGAGAQSVYRSMAVAASPAHLERYDVMVVVPGLVGHPELGCAVGRTGRVVFAARPADTLRRLWAKLGLS